MTKLPFIMKPQFTALTLLFSALSFTPGSAQEEVKKFSVRVLAVGEEPPMKIINNGKKRIEADVDEDLIPPRKIAIITDAGKSEANIRLGCVSDGKVVNVSESLGLQLFKSEEAKEGVESKGKCWVNTKLNGLGPDSLVIVFRKGLDKKWDNAQSITLNNGLEKFPMGATRITNVSPLPVIVKVNGRKMTTLAPGRSFLAKGVKKQLPVSFYALNKSKKEVRIYQAMLNMNGARRTNMVLYGAKPRSKFKPPVAVTVIHSSAPNAIEKRPKVKTVLNP